HMFEVSGPWEQGSSAGRHPAQQFTARRPRMARLHQWIGLAALSLALTGCVSQEKYAALKLERDQLAGRTGQLERDVELSRNDAESLRQQLARIGQGDAAAAARIDNLMSQLSDR